MNLIQNADLTKKVEHYNTKKLGKDSLMFRDNEVEENRFYRTKTSVFLKNVDIEEALVFNKISFDEKNYKYFVGCLHNYHKVKPLHIKFPKPWAHVKSYNGQTKWMYFQIQNDGLLEKHKTIWDNISADIKDKFDLLSILWPVYNKENI